jgi:hypothetical protein
MPQDINKALEVDNGIIIDNSAGIFSGEDSPINLNLPLGSLYLRTNGEVWVRGVNLGIIQGGTKINKEAIFTNLPLQ